jgi:hypothetical protein
VICKNSTCSNAASGTCTYVNSPNFVPDPPLCAAPRECCSGECCPVGQVCDRDPSDPTPECCDAITECPDCCQNDPDCPADSNCVGGGACKVGNTDVCPGTGKCCQRNNCNTNAQCSGANGLSGQCCGTGTVCVRP